MNIHSSILPLLCKSPKDVVTVWDKAALSRLKTESETFKTLTPKYAHLSSIIDQLGVASSKAQALPQAITSTSKILSTDTTLYLYCEDGKAIGLLKVGNKKLFYRNEHGAYKEIEPLCVLDFYVHETMQRKGVGLKLFNYMLQRESVHPAKLGYDRPSPKLIDFLHKRFALRDYIPQANNYVIFKRYFTTKATTSPNKENDKKDEEEEVDTQTIHSKEENLDLPEQKQNGSPKANLDSTAYATGTTRTTPTSRKYVQYNPISHHYQEVEVQSDMTTPQDAMRRTGRRRCQEFSPEVRRNNQIVIEDGNNSPISKLTSSMKALSFGNSNTDVSSPLPQIHQRSTLSHNITRPF